MNQIMKKTKRILLIVLGIVAVTVLLSLLQYLLYSRNHYSRQAISYSGDGILLLEGGSEYEKSIPVKLDGTYFDYGIFYPEKDGLQVEADRDGKVFFDGYYYVGNMRDYLPDFIENDDGTNIYWNEHSCRLAYADYQENGFSSFIFCFQDISKIIKNGKAGQKGILVVTESDSITLAEVIQKAIQETEQVNCKNGWKEIEPIWEDYIVK